MAVQGMSIPASSRDDSGTAQRQEKCCDASCGRAMLSIMLGSVLDLSTQKSFENLHSCAHLHFFYVLCMLAGQIFVYTPLCGDTHFLKTSLRVLGKLVLASSSKHKRYSHGLQKPLQFPTWGCPINAGSISITKGTQLREWQKFVCHVYTPGRYPGRGVQCLISNFELSVHPFGIMLIFFAQTFQSASI